MAADFDSYLEAERASRYDGGNEDKPRDEEDERGNEEEEQDEDGERADEVARLWTKGTERRALIEQSLEDDERCLKSHMEVI